MNKIILVGRIGQNPEIRYTQNGSSVMSFSIATSKKWKDKDGQRQEKTEWHRIVVWGKSVEVLSQMLQKGSLVLVEGEMTYRQWQDKEGISKTTAEVVGQNVQLLSEGKRTQNTEIPQEDNSPEGW